MKSRTHPLVFLNLVVNLLHFLQILEMQLQQPVHLLVVILSEFAEESLPLRTLAVPHHAADY